MAEPPPPSIDQTSTSTSTSSSSNTAITDLNIDSLVHCASYLNLRDISNMAMSCNYLKRVAYSDSIWQRFSRERWSEQISSIFPQASSVREAYLARHTALNQFKFIDPSVADLYTAAQPFNHLLLNDNDIVFSQGSLVDVTRMDSFSGGRASLLRLSDHRARITCIRLYRSEAQRNDNILVTSSCDHSIRLWWKGTCLRCFRGHNGPVSTLSDKLLGDGRKIFASGGEDANVRLWSLSSTGKRGQKATLYGHEKPIVSMSVAGILSRYGIHSVPSILIVNRMVKTRYHGPKSLSSFVQFYMRTTGLDPVVDLPEDQGNYSESGHVLLQPWKGNSAKEILMRELYLVFSALFLFSRVSLYFFPRIISNLIALWFAFVPHLNMGILGELSHLLGRVLHVIDFQKLWSKLKRCKTRNLHNGARNARVWASSLASVSLGETSSGRSVPLGNS